MEQMTTTTPSSKQRPDLPTRMTAVLHERFGRPHDALRVGEVDLPEIEDQQVLVRVRATSVNPSEWYRVTGPLFARVRERPPPAEDAVRPRRPRRDRRTGRQGRDRVSARRRGVRDVGRLLGRVRAAPDGAPRAEAGERLVRGRGRGPGRRDHRPPGPPQGKRPTRAEGADQRSVRRRRHLRRAAPQGLRRGRDGRAARGTSTRRTHSAPTGSWITPKRTSPGSASVTRRCSTSPAAGGSPTSAAS